MSEPGEYWVSSYLPPNVDDFDDMDFYAWQDSTGPHAELDWIWFPSGWYTELEIRLHVDLIKAAGLQGVSDGSWPSVAESHELQARLERDVFGSRELAAGLPTDDAP